MRTLLFVLHITAALLLSASPVISYIGQDHLDMEFHASDKDDTTKDVEDESEAKDLISIDPSYKTIEIQNQVTHWNSSPVNLLSEDYLDVFTPPPENC